MSKNKILVTGAFGFIGSHLCEFLIKKGYSVIAFDRYNITNNYGWLENSKYKNDIEFILGDIRDFDSVSKVIKKSNKCIHLAALIGIPYSYVSPLAYIRTNIEGTYNILESCKLTNIDELIITSTSEVYGTLQHNPMNEDHPINPQSPYAASKISADNLGISYFKSFDLPIKIARPFNVYGPRQSQRAVIPTIINQILNQKELYIGNTNIIRDFTFVDDTISGFYSILKCKKLFGQIINIGSNNSIKIKDIVDITCKYLNKNTTIIKDKRRVRAKNSEVLKLVCDNLKLKKFTKWNDKIKFEKGIIKTIEWNKKYNKEFKKNNYYV